MRSTPARPGLCHSRRSHLLQPTSIGCHSGTSISGASHVRAGHPVNADMANRVEVRLDIENHHRHGARPHRGAYGDILRSRRKEAIERLIGLNVEAPSDSEILSRELEAAHEPGGLH